MVQVLICTSTLCLSETAVPILFTPVDGQDTGLSSEISRAARRGGGGGWICEDPATTAGKNRAPHRTGVFTGEIKAKAVTNSLLVRSVAAQQPLCAPHRALQEIAPWQVLLVLCRQCRVFAACSPASIRPRASHRDAVHGPAPGRRLGMESDCCGNNNKRALCCLLCHQCLETSGGGEQAPGQMRGTALVRGLGATQRPWQGSGGGAGLRSLPLSNSSQIKKTPKSGA